MAIILSLTKPLIPFIIPVRYSVLSKSSRNNWSLECPQWSKFHLFHEILLVADVVRLLLYSGTCDMEYNYCGGI